MERVPAVGNKFEQGVRARRRNKRSGSGANDSTNNTPIIHIRLSESWNLRVQNGFQRLGDRILA